MFKYIKQLASYVKQYKIFAILTPIIVSLEVVMECLIPFFTADLITYVQQGYVVSDAIITKWFISFVEFLIPGKPLAVVAGYCILLVLMALCSLTFGATAGITCSKASCGFAKNLRTALFTKTQDFSFENVDKFSTSSLVTRLTTDVTNVQQSFMMIIRTAIRSPLMFIFSIVMSIIRGGAMSLIFVVVIPVLLFGLIFIAKKAMPIFKKVFKKYDALNESVQENVHGMRVVKSFVRENHESDKFKTASHNVSNDFLKADKILAFNDPIMLLCMYAVMTFVCLFGSQAIVKGDIIIGEFSALLTYGMQILMSLMMLSMIFVMITMSTECAKRICEVLNEETTIKNPENPVMVVENGDITFKDVCFKYNERAEKNALCHVNLDIKSGQTVGIIGGTGSAKSTLISLIPRLYDATEGEVLVGGVNVKDYDLVSLRDSVSVVLQKNILFSGTIKDNLRWGDQNATDEDMERVCKLACADEFIKSFPEKYDTYIEQGGTNVSGGQKQRLCIARALLKKPKILILDDSTSAVDTRTDAVIRRAFKEEIPDTTKIIIAQRISSVQDADIIIILDDGKINDIGTHDVLLERNTIYKEVYESQTRGGTMQ